MRRTPKRIVLLTFVLTLVGAVVSLTLVYRWQQLHEQIHHHRDYAVDMVANHRYSEAIKPLRAYLAHHDEDDVEAIYYLAVATQQVAQQEADSDSQLLEAIQLCRRVIAIDPKFLPAKLLLLDLYQQLHFPLETLEIANRILANHPERVDVMRIKAQALEKLSRYTEALAAAKQWAQASPDTALPQLLVLRAMRQTADDPAELLTYAQNLETAHPDDPRYQFLHAYAHQQVGEFARAQAILQSLPSSSWHETSLVPQVVQAMDGVHLYEQSMDVLRDAAVAGQDPWALEQLVRRLWQRSDADGILKVLSDVPTESQASNTNVLAFKALALTQVGDTSGAESIIEVLRQRAAEPQAAAWSIFLGGVWDKELDLQTSIRRSRLAARKDAQNTCVQFALAGWLRTAGDQAGAIEAYTAAISEASNWAEPRLQLAMLLLECGASQQALTLAEQAQRKRPDDLRCDIVRALALDAHLRAGGDVDTDALLELMRSIQTRQLGEPQTLVSYISLLMQQNRREDAGEVFLDSLDRNLPETVLMRLASISRDQRLGLTETCYVQSEVLHGWTPTLALARAMDLHQRGNDDAAQRLLTHGMQRKAGTAEHIPWLLAHARLLDAIGSEDAVDVWREVVQLAPDQLAVQTFALASHAVWEDRPLLGDTIARLRLLTGPESIAWRVAEARRLLIQSQDMPDPPATAAKAALLLGEVVRRTPMLIKPRMMLAEAFIQMDNPQAAVEQLLQAHEAEPYNQTVAIELARLLIAADASSSEAMAMLKAVVNNPAASAQSLQQAASLLMQLSGWDQAAAALTRALEDRPAAETPYPAKPLLPELDPPSAWLPL